MIMNTNGFNRQLFMRRAALIIYDILAVAASSALGLLMRFDMSYAELTATRDADIWINSIWHYLPVCIVVTIALFYLFKMYHSLWTYAGIAEMGSLIVSCLSSGVAQFIGMQLILHRTVPRSYYFMYTMWLIVLIAISRFAYRLFRTFVQKRSETARNVNVMVIGAGEAGNSLIREMNTSRYIQKAVCCVIDDDPAKMGAYIHGVKVVGGRYDIIEAVGRYNIDEIIVALPSMPRKEIRAILDICQQTKCDLKTLPGIYQLVNGEVSVSQLRKVDVTDLLGRDPVKTDTDSILGYVKGKTVLVTGGGGTIGSELCRQIVTHQPKRLIIFDIYENNAYDIQQELRMKYPEFCTDRLLVLIGSVRNTARIEDIFEKYHPDIIYHAAAHKHVPLMEISPNEAIKNNVMGTWKVCEAALKYKADRFVLISTDKAVNPTNIMGATKRICEMIVQSYDKMGSTSFVAVRFGNVLGSSGSVIPLFNKQIEAGGPVTVTDPRIIRYFMTIPEAVSLVIQAGAYAKGGEIFVLDMGEPVKILDLAKNLIRLSGFVPGEDIEIKFTGLRPGEKLYEEMLMDEEGLQETPNKLIHIGKPIDMDADAFFRDLAELNLESKEEKADVREWIKNLVPTYEYTPGTGMYSDGKNE